MANAPLRTTRAADVATIRHYWRVGSVLAHPRYRDAVGTRLCTRLSKDLHAAFPQHKGLSGPNLWTMRRFADAWPDGVDLLPVSRLPWRHVVTLINALDARPERDFYALRALEYGWSNSVLVHMIDIDLHLRHGDSAPGPPPGTGHFNLYAISGGEQ
ncbi:DUF1016 N-terminal domain-containing protein [Yinghuangia seranimata]|nr:DUF1016 N-terminal domain-containing protein [Yinghuangia seranimata]MDI2130334.1 DUF1016 N-terminal domain-containing protein [Yinghuangia seranimata]